MADRRPRARRGGGRRPGGDDRGKRPYAARRPTARHRPPGDRHAAIGRPTRGHRTGSSAVRRRSRAIDDRPRPRPPAGGKPSGVAALSARRRPAPRPYEAARPIVRHGRPAGRPHPTAGRRSRPTARTPSPPARPIAADRRPIWPPAGSRPPQRRCRPYVGAPAFHPRAPSAAAATGDRSLRPAWRRRGAGRRPASGRGGLRRAARGGPAAGRAGAPRRARRARHPRDDAAHPGRRARRRHADFAGRLRRPPGRRARRPAARPPADLDDILARARERGQRPFVLVLDSLEDPQNFGTLAAQRRSDAACTA